MPWSRILKVDDPITFIIIILSIALAWCVLALPLLWLFSIDEDSGRLGDTFGILTSGFSALAFGGLVYTIFLQKKELRETRAEFEKQNETLKQQQFESTFFKLISLHKEAVDGGEQYFIRVKAEIKRAVGEYDLSSNLLTGYGNAKIAEAEKVFKRCIHQSHIHYIQKYLQSLTSILKYLDETKLIGTAEKDLYYSILDSTFGRNERRILFYHMALFSENDKTLKKLFQVEAKKTFLRNIEVNTFHSSHDKVLRSKIMERIGKLNP